MKLNRVFVSEDIDSNNLGVVTMLQKLDYNIIGHSQYCDEAFLKIKKAAIDHTPYDLLITDLSFENPSKNNKINGGKELIAAVKAMAPEIKVIVFSVEDNQSTIKSLFEEHQIDGYVCKGLYGLKELQNCIEAIADNHQYTCPVATAVLHQKNVLQLSSYEEEILLLLAKGFKQNEISKLLKEKDISPNSVRSVEANISRLKDYFNATNTTHLVYVVSNLGLI
jgi:DNA-binding NarL/FixJ family response regulator